MLLPVGTHKHKHQLLLNSAKRTLPSMTKSKTINSMLHEQQSDYFQSADDANEQQIMLTPIEKGLKPENQIVLDNNIKRRMGSASAAADVCAFDNKLSLCDLPFHPLSFNESLNKNNSELITVQVQPKLEPLKMRSSQSNFITNKMCELRESERAAATKRRKTNHCSAERQAVGFAVCDEPDDDCDSDSAACSISISGARFEIQDELNAHPTAIQIVATAGGLITHWNNGFSKITKPSSSLRKIPLTIFDLVDHKSLPSLYSMLALALHNIEVSDVENLSLKDKNHPGAPVIGSRKNRLRSSASHLSITVPCKSFWISTTSYNITVVFMDDIVSEDRCFLGILTPSEASPASNAVSSSPGSQDEERANVEVQEERDGSSSASKEPSASLSYLIPSGRVVRVNDYLLCRILLGTH